MNQPFPVPESTALDLYSEFMHGRMMLNALIKRVRNRKSQCGSAAEYEEAEGYRAACLNAIAQARGMACERVSQSQQALGQDLHRCQGLARELLSALGDTAETAGTLQNETGVALSAWCEMHTEGDD